MSRALPPALAVFLVSAFALAAEPPALSFAAEHTNTHEARDIARFAGRIWVATRGGLSVHDGRDGRFLFVLTSRDGLPGNSVNRLAPTPRGTLLAAGDYGLAEISPRCDSPSPSCIAESRPFSPRVFDPIVDVVSTGAAEPFLLAHQSGLRDLLAPTPSIPMGGMWRAAARGAEGVLVGGMDGGLALRPRGAAAADPILDLDAPVLDIAAVDGGFLVVAGSELVLVSGRRLRPVLDGARKVTATALASSGPAALVGTSRGEIFEYRGGGLALLGRVDGAVSALFADGSAIWVGVSKLGLVRFDRATGSASGSLSRGGEICSNHVTRLATFRGTLVAGTFDNGACALVDGAWRLLDGMDGQYVHGVASDGAHLWVATSNGLYRYDASLSPAPLGDGDPKELRWFAASAVTALAETEGGFAVGSPWGVVRVTKKGTALRAEFVSRFKGAPEHLTAIAAARGGLFAASETDGVRFVGKRRKDGRAYLDPVHLPEAWVLDVAADGVGFWAATCQSGVSFFDGERALFARASAGLADDRTVGVAPFGGGAFVATLGGLSFAFRDATATAPFEGSLPDPRGAGVYVHEDALYYSTESGLAVFDIR